MKRSGLQGKARNGILFLGRGILQQEKGSRMREKITFWMAVMGTISFFIGILFLSFEVTVFSDSEYGFLKKEYQKYNVQDDLEMEMPDIMFVTKEMMSYLKGEREELSAVTMIGGIEKEFFNEQDRFHMEEVQKLMLGVHDSQYLFLAAGVFLMAAAGLLGYGQKKNSANGMLTGICLFLTITIAGIIFGALNFETLFRWFHLLLFDNDKWLFDPVTDYMIRMLPEGLFMDIAFRIGLIFAAVAVVFLVLVLSWKIIVRRREDSGIYSSEK